LTFTFDWPRKGGSLHRLSGVHLHWIEPGKPTLNAYIERFNGSFRRGLLDQYLFPSLRHVREQCQQWQHDYNHLRPHEALNFLTPIEFRQAAESLVLTGAL
jgi:putative transposase